jgi:signal transduction histidine kinase
MPSELRGISPPCRGSSLQIMTAESNNPPTQTSGRTSLLKRWGMGTDARYDMDRRRSLILRWTVGGVLFGSLFPAVGWLLAGSGISIAGVSSAHTSQNALWIIDLAPIVLGVAGILIGVAYANVDASWRAADEKVKEQTAGLREANSQLEALIRSKDQFVATVSHEVKTPLTVILGFADEIQGELSARGDADLAELAELVGDQGREITNIIEDLLVAARADVGTMTVVPELVDLGDQVRTVVRGCVCAKDVRDAITLDVVPSQVYADPSRVRQIIRNLLTNAIRYGGERIVVVVRDSDGASTVCVCDDGQGIREDEQQLVFEAYQQGHTDTPVSGSVGLGLSVSRHLARQMGGDLSYAFEGGISTFELSLPATESTGGEIVVPVAALVS